MRPVSAYPPLSPNERIHALARLLASALLRLRDRYALAAESVSSSLSKNSRNPAEIALRFPTI
jgi:hypothetical protein